MTTIAIVYHSGFGHTKAVAEHVAKGVESVAGAKALLLSVDQLPPPGPDRALGGRWSELNAADAMIFGSPTYMGDISAEFKKFMESSSGLWFNQAWKDKIAGGFVNSGSPSGDKLNSLQSMITFAMQHSMIWVSLGLKGGVAVDGVEGVNRLGSYSGVMTQSDNASPAEAPPQNDRKTAELLGARIAHIASQIGGRLKK